MTTTPVYLHEYASRVCLPGRCDGGDGGEDIDDATHRINFPPVIAVPPSSPFLLKGTPPLRRHRDALVFLIFRRE